MQSSPQLSQSKQEPSSTSPASATHTYEECGERVRKDAESGEFICEGCGLVVREDCIDGGPEWRSFGNETNSGQKKRVGAPVKEYRHDKGLSTNIGWDDKDAYGNNISGKKRRQMKRLRRWNKRFKTSNAKERNIKQAFSEIRRMAAALGLGEDVTETACVLYRRCVEKDMLPGRSIEGMASACMYAASRICNAPRTLNEIHSVSRVESDYGYSQSSELNSAYMYVVRELGLEMKPVDPRAYLNRILTDVDAPDKEIIRQRAVELLELAEEHNLHSGRAPIALAGGAIYTAAGMEEKRVLQADVAESADVAVVTIRERYQELVAAYKGISEGDVCHEFPKS